MYKREREAGRERERVGEREIEEGERERAGQRGLGFRGSEKRCRRRSEKRSLKRDKEKKNFFDDRESTVFGTPYRSLIVLALIELQYVDM